MTTIKKHPVYQNYEFNEIGQYRLVDANETAWLNGKQHSNRYFIIYLKRFENNKQKTMWLHRAIWEAFNGVLEPNMEIDHIDKNPANNHICNLRAVTISENRKARDHSFIKKMVEEKKGNIRPIKSFNLDNNESFVFANKTRASRYFGCSPALIYAICSGKVKTFGGVIRFEYTEDAINKEVPRKAHKKKYNTEEERKNARKEYAKRYRAKKKASQNE